MSHYEWAVLIFMSPASAAQRGDLEATIAELLSAESAGRASFTVLVASVDGKVGQLYSVDDAPARSIRGRSAPARLLRVATLDARSDKEGSPKQVLLKQLLFKRFSEDGPWRDAPKTMLVLWGHAQGVASGLSSAGSPLYTALGGGGFGYSPVTGDALTAPMIASALRQARDQVNALEQKKFYLDLLAFDSCFMSTAEAAYELRGLAEHLLASQSAIPLAGFDYTALANSFAFPKNDASSEISAKDVASELIAQVGQDPEAPLTLTLISLDEKLQRTFREHLGRLSEELISVLGIDPERPAELGNRADWIRVRAAFEQAAWQQVRQFIDLPDLCRRLANYCRDGKLRQSALALGRFLADSVVGDTRSAPPALFGGLSVFCAWLLPTPEEAEAGAWNAAVRDNHYKLHALFASAKGEPTCRWPVIAWQPTLVEEGQRNAFHREIRALRELRAPSGGAAASRKRKSRRPRPIPRFAKPPNGAFHTEEPRGVAESYLSQAQSESRSHFRLPLSGIAPPMKR